MSEDWVPHVIRRGEHLSRLACARQSTVAIIWEDPKNARLRAKRSNPDVLAPTDVVWLPPKPDPNWMPLEIGAVNRFVAKVPTHTVKIKICDEDRNALAGMAFDVDDGATTFTGTTDGDGTATFDVTVLTQSVVIRIPEKRLAIPVLVGDLDPVSGVSGAIGRLRNLGYGRHPSEIDDVVDTMEYAAFLLAWFQQDHGLPATGELDQATQDKLQDVGGADGTGLA